MDVIEVERPTPGFVTSLASGAAAGLSVDLLFYPIDTIKTRLQSAQGFWRSGGLRGVYRGMGSVAVGSAPGASIFFVTYETCKDRIARLLYPESSAAAMASAPSVHMAAGTLGEMAACLVRVPTDVVKSRQQTSAYGRISSYAALRQVVATEGVRGLYRGYGSTIFREIPFTCIQFPLYEYLKRQMQIELLKMQAWVKESGEKVVLIFEGRDAAGKGGSIKRFNEHLNPRGARTVALEKPTEEEASQWYFQRYIQHLEFMRETPELERMLVNSGVHIIKFWFSVSQREQLNRFAARETDPVCKRP